MNVMDLGPHSAYIWASYLVSFAVLGGLILWLRLDALRQDKLLTELEARGIRRRSARKPARGAKKASQ